MINRRHALGLFAAAGVLPVAQLCQCRASSAAKSATTLPSTSSDEGTAGTFVGYKVDDYLIIASDKDRSGEAQAAGLDLQDSEFADRAGDRRGRRPRQGRLQVGRRQAQDRGLESRITPCARRSRSPRCRSIRRSRGASAQERMQKYVDLFEYGNRNIGGGIDQFWLTGDLRIDPVPAGRFRRPAAPRRVAGLQAQPGSGARYPPGHQGRRCRDPRQVRPAGRRVGKPSLGWMVGWAEKGDARAPCSRSTSIATSRAISPTA